MKVRHLHREFATRETSIFNYCIVYRVHGNMGFSNLDPDFPHSFWAIWLSGSRQALRFLCIFVNFLFGKNEKWKTMPSQIRPSPNLIMFVLGAWLLVLSVHTKCVLTIDYQVWTVPDCVSV